MAPQRLGKYELQELLGRGGMAEVWKAFDAQLKRYVAIKLLHANLQADPDFVHRFVREAQVIAALRHPNIVQIYDFHIVEEGEAGQPEETIAYMVMEYVKGQTLAHYINNTSRKKEFPPAATLLRLLTPISLAIDYAHQQGTIHRDIKPANILLDQSNTARNPMGEPILSDFGIAKLLNATSQTISGTFSGTPLYIAPEQVQGQPVSDRTDLYSLGIVYYELFTGTPPFSGETLTSIMMKQLVEAPTDPRLLNSALPAALSPVLIKSLAKKPQDRYPSAAAMTAAVAQAFRLPVPQDLQLGIAAISDEAGTMYESRLSGAAPDDGATRVASQAMLMPDRSAANYETVSTGDYLPIDGPTVRANPTLPDSEPRLPDIAESKTVLPQHSIAPAGQPSLVSASMPAPVSYAPRVPSPVTPMPPSEMPTPPKKQPNWLRLALVILVICVLLGGGLGAFLLTRHPASPVAAAPTTVGQAIFVSSGQLNMTTNQGSMDQLQINLQHIPNPASGQSYYAWLLPDIKNAEAPDILLGKLSANNGVIHFFYPGDSQHTNLLAITSRFLITEEPSNVTPQIPSPNLSNWKYYTIIPQTPAPGQQYSLLDHLRHLLAADPELDALNLHGGLNIWTYRNMQQIQDDALSAQNDWNVKHYNSLRHQIVAVLDYLDGLSEVSMDLAPGTSVQANPQYAQIGMLEFDPVHQNPPGYLYHIALHLNGVLASPGSTQYQRNLANQINNSLANVRGWLEQARHDAVQMVRLNDTQLAQTSTLTLINDMVTMTTRAYTGYTNPASGQLDDGVSQLYLQIPQLATLQVQTYKQG
jgi:serine/threonine protein kinase